ncbi:MAG: class I SAM-dependent methyltransferase, partial [Candidatus Nanopelagicales bacterium]
PQARWPALPFFRDRMVPGGRVILDDMIRQDEQAILEDWVGRYSGVAVQGLDFEKGAAVLTLPA